jgi:hypothetical protein
VSNFLAGRVTTKELLGAFMTMFPWPKLPPPMVVARSYEEACRFMDVMRQYDSREPTRRPPLQRSTGQDDQRSDKTDDVTTARQHRVRVVK